MSGFGQDYREEIKNATELVGLGKKDEALDVLDNLNWRKIHNISAIVQASQLYESMGKIEDAKDLLMMAHERSPIGRVVLYNLCLLCARSGDLDEAKEYYNDFVDIAPHDFQKYVLKYYISEKRGADEYTLIGILEELKNNELIDEWAYQLAFLYHKTNQVDKCIELCDEIALYYGDGVFVEKALELKMLYQPLSNEQKNQYRNISGNVLMHDEEEKAKAPIRREIPEPKANPHKFDTVNLQAEIKKNIDEIMQATEAGEVSETMENIQDLVGELPYLTESLSDIKGATEEKEKSLMDHYKHFLAEEYDGQISLALPTESVVDEQIAGQMSIEDVLQNWEKTSRAAQAALEESAQERLEKSKEQAIAKANQIIDRLEKAKPLLDAGVDPQFLMKDEILASNETEEPVTEEPVVEESVPEEPVAEEPIAEETVVEEPVSEEWKKDATFPIPKIDEDGNEDGVGIELPIINHDGKPETEVKAHDKSGVSDWVPPVVSADELGAASEEVYQDATQIMTNVNNMLQAELDKLASGADVAEEAVETGIDVMKAAAEVKAAEEKVKEKAVEVPANFLKPGAEEELTKLHLSEDDEEPEERADVFEEFEVKDGDDESILAQTLIDKNQAKVAEKKSVKEAKERMNESQAEKNENLHNTVVLEPLDEHLADEVNADEVVSNVDEEVLQNQIEDEMPMQALTEDERDLFSYFLPIPNMEKTIISVLTGARERLLKEGASSTGNIIISGGRGSGKTTLAKALILTLQNEIDKPGKNIGKIDAEKLNGKDLQELYSRVKGGCLVIEQAGDLLLDTEVSLSLLMDNDTEGTLVILEDNRAGIDRALQTYAQFAKKFTEKIEIPVFTIDELVTFGIKYADDAGYHVDEMGRLAMYDRISKAQRTDRPLYLKDVIDIMDDAIDKSNSKGFFKRKRVDEDGRPVLVEKDFL